MKHPHRPDADLSHLWAVIAISNTPRFKRRYELFHPFYEMLSHAGINTVVVEMQLGHREFMVTECGNPNHIQIRSVEEFWHKENLQNIGWRRAIELDPLIREVCFIDADIRPMAHPRHWFEETWHELQHYQAVQMYEYIMNLDSESNPLNRPGKSFMGSYCRGARRLPVSNCASLNGKPNSSDSGAFWLGSPGGAWGWNHDALMAVGGLLDVCILGSSDWHMAQGLLGFLEPAKGENWSKGYSSSLYNWQERAVRELKKDIGFVRGGLLHDNHGSMATRYYVDRKKILVEGEFDPNTDLKRDAHGLYQIERHSERQIKMYDDMRDYFRSRLEDSPEFLK